MKKVVYNAKYGGFGLTVDALYLLLVMGFPLKSSPLEKSGYTLADFPLEGPDGVRAHGHYSTLLKDDRIYHFDDYAGDAKGAALRSHPVLVHVVEKLGERANGAYAKLQIEELSDDALYAVEEYDGNESVRLLSETNYTAGYLMTTLDVPDAKPILTPPSTS